MENKTSYFGYQEKIRKANVEYKDFVYTNFWSVLMNYPETYKIGETIFKVNITSMCLKNDPSKVRLRNDIFLKKAINHKFAILVSSYKINNKIFHYILSSNWFESYSKKQNVSNSFINFDFKDLELYANNPGYQYKKILKDKTKYIFLIASDEDFNIDKLNEYLKLSENSHNNFLLYNVNNVKNDPQIPLENKKKIYSLANYSCLIHKFDDKLCRTKINWFETKKAIEGTNLNVPIDFHHFVPRSLFKKEWLKTNDAELDWNFIHSTINLIPLCQICHQSIHNKDKKLAEQTFDNIVVSLKKENLFDIFIEYLKRTNFLNDLNDLKKFYLDYKGG